MDLQNETFLITGGASGLGAACARRFAAAGAKVAIADVQAQPGAALADQLGEAAVFHHVDVTNPDDVSAVLKDIRDTFGPLRSVINCAGILGAARLVGRDGPHDLDSFRRVVEVNLVGTFNVLRLAAAEMSENEPGDDGQRGVIINTASIAAFEGQIGQAAYAASKGGIASLTLPAARELARFGIRVVAIAPGAFATEMMEATPEEIRTSLTEQTPFPRRLGAPDEFAALAEHIVENRMLNGCVVRLDGAMRMGPK